MTVDVFDQCHGPLGDGCQKEDHPTAIAACRSCGVLFVELDDDDL